MNIYGINWSLTGIKIESMTRKVRDVDREAGGRKRNGQTQRVRMGETARMIKGISNRNIYNRMPNVSQLLLQSIAITLMMQA